MSQQIVPGPNNQMVTSSYAPIAYYATDPSLNIILVDASTTISKPSGNTATAIYAVDAWNGMVVITLPPSDGNSQYLFKKIDGSANPVRIVPSGSNTIDGAALQSIGSQWGSMRVISYDTGSWYKF